MAQAPEFYRDGIRESELIESTVRYHAREGRVFDHSNDTVVVTRALLLTAADEIQRLRERRGY